MDVQRGGIAGSARSNCTSNPLWSIGIYGSSLLDSRVLGSCTIGDALHHVHYSVEVLDAGDLTRFIPFFHWRKSFPNLITTGIRDKNAIRWRLGTLITRKKHTG